MARERLSHHPPRWFFHKRYRNYRSTTASCTTVLCHSDSICTVVTSAPSVVREWLFRMRRYHTHRLRKNRLLVGFGVQWTPSFEPGRQNPPATLQLSVGHHCLISQLSHAPRLPLSLRRFLSDPNITFVGVSNKRDSHLLRYYSKHELCVGRLIDLVDVASEMRGYGKVMSMEKLAGLVLGMEGVRKDPAIGKSNWDEIWLSDDQVEYACVDAFISFLLGKSLKAWNWNREDFDGGFYHDDDDSDESY